MITGLRIRIPSDDIRKHIEIRFEFHKTKADAYNHRLNSLKEIPSDVNMTADPIAGLKSKIEEHQQKAMFFGLLAAYIVKGETYDLDVTDLTKLEYVSRWF